MTFTYAPGDGFADLERVRFWLGDTDSTKAKFSDEEINAVLADSDTWQDATLALLESLIARLSSQTDFKADWLEVKVSQAVAQLRGLLSSLEKKWGLGAGAPSGVSMSGGGINVYRADSLMTESPTYNEED